MTSPTTDFNERARPQLARASVAAVVVNVGGSGMRLLLQVVLARSLGVSDYGRFVLGRSWGELLARFPNRGYEATAVKVLPHYDRSGEFGLFRGFVRASWRVTLFTAAALTIVACGIYSLLADDPDSAILWGFVLIGPLALTHLVRSLLQGNHRFVVGSTLIELLHPAVFGVSIAVLWSVDRLTVSTALIAWLTTMAVAAATGHLVLQRGYSPAIATAVPISDTVGWRTTRRPLYASHLAFVVLDYTDILVVGALLERADVATYAVATRVAVLGRIIIAGVQSVASSHLADAAATKDWPETQRIVDRSLRVCALPSIAITAAAALLAEPLVGLFGSEYAASATILRILLVGNLVNSITGPSGYVVSLSGLEVVYARLMWSAAATTVILVTLGTIAFGAAGAAWAATSVMVGWNLSLVVIAKRRLNVSCWARLATFRTSS